MGRLVQVKSSLRVHAFSLVRPTGPRPGPKQNVMMEAVLLAVLGGGSALVCRGRV